MGKEFSANSFNDRWATNAKDEYLPEKQIITLNVSEADLNTSLPHQLFKFNKLDDNEILTPLFISIFPDFQGGDSDELDFARRMKKKKEKKTTLRSSLGILVILVNANNTSF